VQSKLGTARCRRFVRRPPDGRAEGWFRSSHSGQAGIGEASQNVGTPWSRVECHGKRGDQCRRGARAARGGLFIVVSRLQMIPWTLVWVT